MDGIFYLLSLGFGRDTRGTFTGPPRLLFPPLHPVQPRKVVLQCTVNVYCTPCVQCTCTRDCFKGGGIYIEENFWFRINKTSIESSHSKVNTKRLRVFVYLKSTYYASHL